MSESSDASLEKDQGQLQQNAGGVTDRTGDAGQAAGNIATGGNAQPLGVVNQDSDENQPDTVLQDLGPLVE